MDNVYHMYHMYHVYNVYDAIMCITCIRGEGSYEGLQWWAWYTSLWWASRNIKFSIINNGIMDDGVQVRVELIVKKFKIFLWGKTVATIYRIKTKFVNVFGFLYIRKCSEFTIFGVKVNLKSVDPKCSYLACRILQISYYLPK